MSRRYYTEPPVYPDLPPFLAKRFAVTHVKKLIQWSIREYDKGLQHLTRHASPRTIRYFLDNYSSMRVLAESVGFSELLEILKDEKVYNELNFRERVFVRRAYHLFQSLS